MSVLPAKAVASAGVVGGSSSIGATVTQQKKGSATNSSSGGLTLVAGIAVNTSGLTIQSSSSPSAAKAKVWPFFFFISPNV